MTSQSPYLRGKTALVEDPWHSLCNFDRARLGLDLSIFFFFFLTLAHSSGGTRPGATFEDGLFVGRILRLHRLSHGKRQEHMCLLPRPPEFNHGSSTLNTTAFILLIPTYDLGVKFLQLMQTIFKPQEQHPSSESYIGVRVRPSVGLT